MHRIILIIIILCGILLAGFFAGTESGIYRMSRSVLRLGIEQKKRFFGALGRLIGDAHSVILSTLVGVNLATYLTTSCTAYLYLDICGDSNMAEFYTVLIITPVMFVFAELIPKNLFVHYADRLMPPFAFVLWFFHRIFTYTGISPLLRLFARVFAFIGSPDDSDVVSAVAMERHHIPQIMRENIEDGHLSRIQSEMIDRLINMPNVQVREVMIPISRVRMLKLESTRAELIDMLRQCEFTKFPVYQGSQNNIVGVVNIYDCLASNLPDTAVGDNVVPAVKIADQRPLLDTINLMRASKQSMAIITHTYGHAAPVGIVTMKDLVEEFIGELDSEQSLKEKGTSIN